MSGEATADGSGQAGAPARHHRHLDHPHGGPDGDHRGHAGRRGRGDRPWRSIVFAPGGDGTTRRRGSDAFRLVVAVLTVLCCWLVSGTPSTPQVAFLHFLTPPPDGVRWLVSTVWWLGSVGVIVALGVLALLSRRRNVARDILLSGLVAWLVSVLLELAVGATGGHTPTPTLKGIDLVFPVARVAATVAVASAALPYLSRGLQRVVEVVIVLAAVTTVVNGSGLPVSVLASLAVGWGVAAAFHLWFGSPLGLPSAADVSALLADLDIDADDVAAAPDQEWGVARFRAADAGGPISASVYGRDAHDAQLLAKTFRFLAYRDSGPTLTLTRVQQVEHEAYLTLQAERSGARVPWVLAAGTAGPSRDAVLVTRPPAGLRLADRLAAAAPAPAAAPAAVAVGPTAGEAAGQAEGQTAVQAEGRSEGQTEGTVVTAPAAAPPPDPGVLPDAAADDLFGQVLKLRAARIAHGSISAATVVVEDPGSAGLTDFRRATAATAADRLDRDLAATLATAGLAMGPERAVASAVRALDADQLAAALPFLQRAALDPVLSRALRGRKALLSALREQGATAAGVDVPKLAEPRRMSWMNFVMVVGTLIGGWALLGVLINVTKSWDTITGARWGWVVATFLLAQLTYPSLAVTTTGSIVDPLSYGRVVALEVANSFVQLAGGTMGGVAARVRFFQQQGYDATMAVSSGVVNSTVSWIVKGALFLIALPIAISQFHFTQKPTDNGGGHGDLVWLIVLIVVAAAVALGLVLLVPRLRRLARDTLRPKLSDVWAHLRVLARHPRNMVEIFGGAVLAQLLVALALGAALHAFGQHLGLAQLLVVLTLASMVGGVSPVPGGMGVVEAGMILCLTAAGIPQTDAVAATFVQRLFTSYLPPIWGWFVLVWMRRKEYL
ncbi:MAG TPA: lysylphosphatidylglycerol synthase transmembrane domain-containing protein [Acidimicrobiales bacterium]|nr:lysylphosphatidylglycerol synthase transmembrane domain-containing protein [Acidimicrobiales bacterium]